MAKRSVTTSEVVNVNGREYTVEELIGIVERVEGRGPGLYPEETDKWCVAKWTRILPGDGGEIVFTVKKSGYIDCQPNLRFSKNRPIPGFGGDEHRWAAYAAYFRGADFVADLKVCVAESRKITKKTAKPKA